MNAKPDPPFIGHTRFRAPRDLSRYRAPEAIELAGGYCEAMLTVIVILLVVWLILAVVGFALEGLLWLGIIGVILFIGTLIFGLVRRAAGRRGNRPGRR